MAKGLSYIPDRQSIVICDFSGFKAPEMTKKRPDNVMDDVERCIKAALLL